MDGESDGLNEPYINEKEVKVMATPGNLEMELEEEPESVKACVSSLLLLVEKTIQKEELNGMCQPLTPPEAPPTITEVDPIMEFEGMPPPLKPSPPSDVLLKSEEVDHVPTSSSNIVEDEKGEAIPGNLEVVSESEDGTSTFVSVNQETEKLPSPTLPPSSPFDIPSTPEVNPVRVEITDTNGCNGNKNGEETVGSSEGKPELSLSVPMVIEIKQELEEMPPTTPPAPPDIGTNPTVDLAPDTVSTSQTLICDDKRIENVENLGMENMEIEPESSLFVTSPMLIEVKQELEELSPPPSPNARNNFEVDAVTTSCHDEGESEEIPSSTNAVMSVISVPCQEENIIEQDSEMDVDKIVIVQTATLSVQVDSNCRQAQCVPPPQISPMLAQVPDLSSTSNDEKCKDEKDEEIKRLKEKLNCIQEEISALKTELTISEKLNASQKEQLDEAAEIMMEQQNAILEADESQQKLNQLVDQERKHKIAAEGKFQKLKRSADNFSVKLGQFLEDLETQFRDGSTNRSQSQPMQNGGEVDFQKRMNSISGLVKTKLKNWEEDKLATMIELNGLKKKMGRKQVRVVEMTVPSIKIRAPSVECANIKVLSAEMDKTAEEINKLSEEMKIKQAAPKTKALVEEVEKLPEPQKIQDIPEEIIVKPKRVRTRPKKLAARKGKRRPKAPTHAEDITKSFAGSFCICGTSFSSRSNLLIHITSSNSEGKFECNICKVRFPYLSFLKRHQFNKHKIPITSDGESRVIGCGDCGETFTNYFDLYKHRGSEHGSKKARAGTSKDKKLPRTKSAVQSSPPLPPSPQKDSDDDLIIVEDVPSSQEKEPVFPPPRTMIMSSVARLFAASSSPISSPSASLSTPPKKKQNSTSEETDVIAKTDEKTVDEEKTENTNKRRQSHFCRPCGIKFISKKNLEAHMSQHSVPESPPPKSNKKPEREPRMPVLSPIEEYKTPPAPPPPVPSVSLLKLGITTERRDRSRRKNKSRIGGVSVPVPKAKASAHFLDVKKKHLGFFCICGSKKYDSEKLFIAHLRYFSLGRKFRCTMCSYTGASLFTIRKHERNVHKIKNAKFKIGCRDCGIVFGTREEFSSHRKSVHGTMTGKPALKPKPVISKRNLNPVLRQAPKSIARRNLNPVMRTNEIAKQSPNPIARSITTRVKRRTKSSVILKDYVEPSSPEAIPIPIPFNFDDDFNDEPSNVVEEPMVDDVDDDDDTPAASSSSVSANHQVDMKSKNGLACTCGRKFPNKGSLTSHLKYRSADWKFKCKICNEPFLFYKFLKKHMMKQHRGMKLSYQNSEDSESVDCGDCGKFFDNRLKLLEHCQLMHKGKRARR